MTIAQAVLSLVLGLLPLAGGIASDPADPGLPFAAPSFDTVLDAPRRVFAHYVYWLPLSLDNKPADQDYYTVNYLNPLGEGRRFFEAGGMLRARPLPVQPRPEADWKQRNMQQEIRLAIARGINGFSFNSMGIADVAAGGHLLLLIEAAQAVDRRFKILLMPDMTAIPDLAAVEKIIGSVHDQPTLYHLPDGRLVLSPFASERHTPEAWSAMLDRLKTQKIDIAFIPTFGSLNPGFIKRYAGISVGLGNFGNPGTPDQLTWMLGSAAQVRAARTPAPLFFDGITPQSYKVPEAFYDEACGSLAYRNAWAAAIQTRADMVQIVTWNDFGESTQISPATSVDGDCGSGFYDLTAYYAAWYQSGVQPPITRDVLYYFHRRQPTDAPAPAQAMPVKARLGQPQDQIELLAFLAAPGTLSITIDGKVATQMAPAGITSFTVPLAPGIPEFALSRNGAPVLTFASGTRIHGAAGQTRGVLDLTYWSGSRAAPLARSKASVKALGDAEAGLPFVMPTPDEVLGSPRKVFAHYFYPFPLSIDNLPAAKDYYAVNYLDPAGENGKFAAQGGFLRARPLPVAPQAAANWRVLNMEREIRLAIARGVNGFAFNVMSPEEVAPGGKLHLMLAAAQAVDPRFRILLMPDISGLGPDTSMVERIITAVSTHPSLFRWSDGRLVVAPFGSDRIAPAAWAALLQRLHGQQVEVAFLPTFLSLAPNLVAGFATLGVVGMGVFQAEGTPDQYDWILGNSAVLKARGLPYFCGLSPQDYRPKDALYFEAHNSLAYRKAWTGAIEAKADLVQIVTWSDLGESTQIEPVTSQFGDAGTGFYDLTGYYASWFHAGRPPPITRDVLYYFHRRQPTSAAHPAQAAAPRLAFGTAQDQIELLAFLTAPGTLAITIDGRTTTQEAPAGITSFLVPLAPGVPEFALNRNGVQVIRFQGKTQIHGAGGHPSGVLDLTYWSGSQSALVPAARSGPPPVKPIELPQPSPAARQAFVARLRERATAAAAAGRGPIFALAHGGEGILERFAGDDIVLRIGPSTFTVAWKTLVDSELLGMALYLSRSGEAIDQALAAFWLRCAGRESEARSRLAQAGAVAAEVEAAFHR